MNPTTVNGQKDYWKIYKDYEGDIPPLFSVTGDGSLTHYNLHLKCVKEPSPVTILECPILLSEIVISNNS